MNNGLRSLFASVSRVASARRALRCSYFSSVAKRPENPRVFDNPADFKPYVLGLRYTEFTNRLELIEDSPVIPIFQVMDVEGNFLGDWKNPFPSDEAVLEHYKTMVRLSIWDNLFYNIQRQGRISFYIQNQGEEAMQVGCGLALKHEDHIFGQYRELGVLYCKGFTVDDTLNQLFANKGDECKGRQMPISYSKKECNIHAICTPLTSQLPHAAGAGYALKLQKAAACAVGFFGEGAASEGDFHAAMNMAAVRQSQTIFACRNNGYAISTPVCDQYYGDGIAIRGVAYGMPTIRVDGNDLFASYIATKHAREHCVTRSTPICIEYMTYRLGHHSTSDESSQYRGPGEFDVWTAGGNNGINRVRKYLEKQGLWDEERDEALRKEARSFMLKKIREVEVVKHVDLSSGIFDDVYDQPHPMLEQQREEFLEHLNRYGENYKLERYEKH